MTANDAYHRPDIKYTDDEMRNHLYMLGTRGTAFWEYYYSYSMFDDNKWQINAEAAKWIEDNSTFLQKSQMFGGKPNDGNVTDIPAGTEKREFSRSEIRRMKHKVIK